MAIPLVRKLGFLIPATLVVGTALGAASTYYRFGREDRIYAFSKPVASDLGRVLAPAGAAQPAKRPRILVEGGNSHDFGIMSRNERRSHRFRVQNAGTGLLQLRFIDKSCQCTDVTMTLNEVPPGEYSEITLTWQPSTFNPDFHQTARFETNDPSRIELDLTVKGKVQQVVEFTPRSLSFDNVTTGQSRQQSLDVFAYRDPDLRVERVELLDADTATYFETETQPVTGESLAAEVGAVAGQTITVRLLPGLPQGRFYQRLRLHLNKPDLGPLEVPVLGSIAGPITIAGPGFDASSGVWSLGKLGGDQEHTKTLWLMVKGDEAAEAQLNVAQLDPAEVLSAELVPSGQFNQVIRYALRLTLRPEGRVWNRLGSDQGGLAEVVIETTLADSPRLEIPVAFALEATP